MPSFWNKLAAFFYAQIMTTNTTNAIGKNQSIENLTLKDEFQKSKPKQRSNQKLTFDFSALAQANILKSETESSSESKFLLEERSSSEFKNSSESKFSQRKTPATQTKINYQPEFRYPSESYYQPELHYCANYPLECAHNLAELNHYRINREYYLELPHEYFVPFSRLYSPEARILALQNFLIPGDILIGKSALWVHTGFISNNKLAEITIARADGRKRKNASRKRIPNSHLDLIAEIKITNLARTAIDLLLADLEFGITALPKLIRTGTNIPEIQNLAEKMNGHQGISRVRSVLAQLREVPSLAKNNSHSKLGR